MDTISIIVIVVIVVAWLASRSVERDSKQHAIEADEYWNARKHLKGYARHVNDNLMVTEIRSGLGLWMKGMMLGILAVIVALAYAYDTFVSVCPEKTSWYATTVCRMTGQIIEWLGMGG